MLEITGSRLFAVILLLRCLPSKFFKTKPGGLVSCWVSAGRQYPDQTVSGWGAFCVKRRGVGRRFWHFDKILRAESKINALTLIIRMLLAQLWVSDWLVVSVIGRGGGVSSCSLDLAQCLETEYRHLVSNPDRYIKRLLIILSYNLSSWLELSFYRISTLQKMKCHVRSWTSGNKTCR